MSFVRGVLVVQGAAGACTKVWHCGRNCSIAGKMAAQLISPAVHRFAYVHQHVNGPTMRVVL